MLSDWNFWCTVMTSVAAVVAIGVSVHQIRLSNKQQLFERRLKAYMMANSIISLCKENYVFLSEKRKAEPQFANDLVFVWLTNNTYMEGQAEAIEHPLEQPFHKELLKKREELRNMAMEFEFIFKGNVASLYGNFLRDYENALAVMYQYEIIIRKMKEENEKYPHTSEVLSKMFSEEEYRDRLYDALGKLKVSYDTVSQEKNDKQLRKQLALI
ncbi:hypothetical protein JXX19_10215 [Ruthenibacterium lactatiformans]|jgi:hypothetical protein|nr:hypothetical protein [Ruthenibacterium lactatiformans]MBN3026792.1 hypothetical protein [Ruthenibacterium lactatiformans]